MSGKTRTMRSLVIRGKVQGVTFRASAKDRAQDLGLVGWVRNNKDGSVSCVVCGPEEDVGEFVEWCKSGSAFAQVEEVETKEIDESCNLQSFEIRY